MRSRRSVTRLLTITLLSASASACNLDLDFEAGLADLRIPFFIFIAQVDSSGITGVGTSSFTKGDARGTFSVAITPVVVGQRYDGPVHPGTCAAVGSAVQTLPVAIGQAGIPQGTAPSASSNFEVPSAYVSPGDLIDFHTTINGVDRRVACGPMV